MTAAGDDSARSVTRSALIAAAHEALGMVMHEYVPDLHDENCAQCNTKRGNWQHAGEVRVAVVVRNPGGQAGPIPREWASVQFDIPLPRPASQ